MLASSRQPSHRLANMGKSFIRAAPAILALAPSASEAARVDTFSIETGVAPQESPYVHYSLRAYESPTIRDDGRLTTIINTAAEKWGEEEEQRFDELSVKFALDELGPGEERELENLQKVRVRELAPRSYEDVKKEFEIEKATAAALRALDDLIRAVTTSWPSTV